jgi:hypothetical protein
VGLTRSSSLTKKPARPSKNRQKSTKIQKNR